MTAEEQIAQLREELAKAHALITRLQAEIVQLRKQLAEDKGPPPFIKPNIPKPKDKSDKKPRGKRAKDQNGARRSEVVERHPPAL